MCLNTETLKIFNFSFETNGKLMALVVPILKHFRVICVLRDYGICLLREIIPVNAKVMGL